MCINGKKVSILVPTLNEISFIGKLFQSISEQTYSADLIEAMIIDGGSTDGTIEFIKMNICKYRFKINILFNSKKYQCYALNMGLRDTTGEIIIRMDAHSEYERDYIKKIVKYLEDKSIVNIGGTAVAKGYDFMSCVIAEALSSPISVGGAKFRYTKKIIETETVFPGAWRKEDLLRINGWNEDWIINEDTELNMRLKKELKGKIIVDPNIKLSYFPRNSLKKLSEQYFNFGCWRIKTVHVHPEALRYSHLLAMFSIPGFLIICIFSLFSMLTDKFFSIYFLLSLVTCYFLTVFSHSIYISFIKYKNSFLKMFCMNLCIFVIHLSWSIGALAGISKYGVPFIAIFKKFYNVYPKRSIML